MLDQNEKHNDQPFIDQHLSQPSNQAQRIRWATSLFDFR